MNRTATGFSFKSALVAGILFTCVSARADDLKDPCSSISQDEIQAQNEKYTLERLIQEHETLYEKDLSKATETVSIFGFKITDTPARIKVLKDVLSERNGGLSESSLAFPWVKVKVACGSNANRKQDVICALSTIFGGEAAAYRVLNIRKRDRVIVSANQGGHDYDSDLVSIARKKILEKEEEKRTKLESKFLEMSKNGGSMRWIWSPNEIAMIEQALSVIAKVPSKFAPQRILKRLFRLGPGEIYQKLSNTIFRNDTYVNGNGTSSMDESPNSNGFIFIFEDLDQDILNLDSKRGTLIHEFSHFIDWKSGESTDRNSRTFSTSGSFLSINWIKGGEDISQGQSFVGGYSSTSPSEDFAESMMTYITNGPQMKFESPKMYDFIQKRVFQGKEFDPMEFNRWPDFDELWGDVGLNEEDSLALAKSCEKSPKYRLGRIECDKGESGEENHKNVLYPVLRIAETDPDNRDFKMSIGVSQYLDNSLCLQELRTKLITKAEEGNWPDYCGRGGQYEVARQMSSKLSRVFHKMIYESELWPKESRAGCRVTTEEIRKNRESTYGLKAKSSSTQNK